MRLDIFSVVGLFMGAGAICYVMWTGGTLHLLWHKEAFILVFGGTLASTLIGTPIDMVLKIPRVLGLVLFPPHSNSPEETIALLVRISEKAKREGVDALQDDVKQMKDKFLFDGITMVIDGMTTEMVRENLEKELTFTRKRHAQISNVVRGMGAYSPIFGLLATLLGVVQVLRGLSDPSSLGNSMAVAVTGTFYGIAAANFIFLPVAMKLDLQTDEELLLKEVMIEGILAIQAGDIPMIVSKKLQAFFSTRLREKKA